MANYNRAMAIVDYAVLPQDLSDIQRQFDSNDHVQLPQQTGNPEWRPEQDLIAAMIEGALTDAALYETPRMKLDLAYKAFMAQRRALGWIFERGEHNFSFEWCCEHVRMDAERIRRMLIQKVARAREIDEHLKDPDKVPAPSIPLRLHGMMRRSKAARKRHEEAQEKLF